MRSLGGQTAVASPCVQLYHCTTLEDDRCHRSAQLSMPLGAAIAVTPARGPGHMTNVLVSQEFMVDYGYLLKSPGPGHPPTGWFPLPDDTLKVDTTVCNCSV